MFSIVHPLIAPFLLVISDQIASAERQRLSTTHDVHLLLTRHGLSCSEIVEKWVGWSDYGRINMPDPLLGVAGEVTSSLAGQDVLQWLAAKKLKIDGVISSELAREIQTALLMFPNTSEPVYIAPYLAVKRSGSANEPTQLDAQLSNIFRSSLHSNLSHTAKVDTRWLNVHPSAVGTWSQFLAFLEQSFLPKFIRTLKKPSGSPIVLAIVTHSSYLKKYDVADQCGKWWSGKPLNNQVFDLRYQFRTEFPSASSVDVTARHKLKLVDRSCAKVTEGVSLDNRWPFCLADIGPSCIEQASTYATQPSTLWDSTIEKQMMDAAESIQRLEQDKLNNIRRQTAGKEKLRILEMRQTPVKCVRKLMSCEPADSCVTNGLGCSLFLDANAKALAESIRAREQITRTQIDDIRHLELKLSDMKQQSCWAGGSPSVATYVTLKDLSSTLHPRALKIALE